MSHAKECSFGRSCGFFRHPRTRAGLRRHHRHSHQGPAGPVPVRVTTPAGTSNAVTYSRIAAPVIRPAAAAPSRAGCLRPGTVLAPFTTPCGRTADGAALHTPSPAARAATPIQRPVPGPPGPEATDTGSRPTLAEDSRR
ncbi:hypothetical protein GCM10010104_42740 [Streptomyces indiaensis]|uniref:Uncharacterized protein n=1 Tax=Streptomyces indiaensis TaxID=284033 RepID=A0ABP5QVD2_9ACTN